MTIPELSNSIRKVFSDEGHRIVFWYDADKDFEDSLHELEIPGITLVRLDQVGSLELKIRLELEDKESRFLLYSPAPEPAPSDNWLLDITLYSRVFHADQASIVLNELGLTQPSLRTFFGRHKTFVKNQDRLGRLKKWVKPEDADVDLELKMLAVLAKAEHPEVFAILMKLFEELSEDKKGKAGSKAWDDIEKYELTEPFWRLMADTFGYSPKEPSLNDLLRRILVTDLSMALKTDLPASLQHFVLPLRSLASTASVFANHWRSNINHYPAYNRLSKRIATELNLAPLLAPLSDQDLRDTMTFEEVEKQVIRSLRGHIVDRNIDLAELESIIVHRQNGHWTQTSSDTEGIDYCTIYDALLAAAKLLNLRQEYASGLSFPNVKAMYNAYITSLYGFDYHYRRFHEAASQRLDGVDVLKELRDVVEDCYGNWYMDGLSVAWSEFISSKNGKGLLQNWRVDGIPNQSDFFEGVVSPILAEYPKGRVYVVVSDALRYETAVELLDVVNQKERFDATITSQLGVLPSFTALGMAALLPHASYGFKSNDSGTVEVDGQPSESLEQRAVILAGFKGTAVKYSDLINMSKEQGREFVKPHRVIYVYHNQIDSTGDVAATETKTFSAARAAIRELDAVTRYIINNLNASAVLITADHGFLYQESALGESAKSSLETKPDGTIKAKKRYLIGRNLGENDKAWHGKVVDTAATTDNMEFWVPKGANRFHFAGGARYTHGGAMPQEIVVPVITVKELRKWTPTKPVGVSLLGTTRKIVNNVQKFELIQTDAVSDTITPRTLSITLRDGEQVISNEVVLTFDSRSEKMEDRKKEANIIVKSGTYDKKRDYHLVLQDKATLVEVDRIPVIIDLAFGTDF